MTKSSPSSHTKQNTPPNSYSASSRDGEGGGASWPLFSVVQKTRTFCKNSRRHCGVSLARCHVTHVQTSLCDILLRRSTMSCLASPFLLSCVYSTAALGINLHGQYGSMMKSKGGSTPDLYTLHNLVFFVPLGAKWTLPYSQNMHRSVRTVWLGLFLASRLSYKS
jgi:hypothetical protein